MRRAIGQREAREESREARYLMSTARARAAAGGGNLSDPSLVNAFADIEAGGEYNALSRLWDAEEEAQGDEMQARAREKEGSASLVSGLLNAGVSFFGKYGGK